MLRTILTVVQVLSGLIIVGLVLLQRGKGADAGAGFGAGASGTVFGARGATTGLSRMTAVAAAIFMINSLFLTYAFRDQVRTAPESILDKVPVSTTAPAPELTVPPVDANAVPVPAAPAEQPAQSPEKP